MFKVFILIFGLNFAAFAVDVEPECFTFKRDEVKSLLAKKCIKLQTKDRYMISFDQAGAVLHREGLLAEVQRGYAAMLPKGEQPEFTIEQVSTNTYSYTNAKRRKTTIYEVFREKSNDRLILSFYSTGERFFGRYESLCVITIVPLTGKEVQYQVEVFAYP